MPNIFSSTEIFKNTFNDGLVELAKDNSLGTFILLMANAIFDEKILLIVKELLKHNFNTLESEIREKLVKGTTLNEVDEDLMVFFKMMCIGFENIKLTEFRKETDWELQFNQTRGFRPARISRQKVEELYQAFDPEKFNFNKTFIQKERLWEGFYNNSMFTLYYNKYPFSPYHTLLVPEREKQRAQFLEYELHEIICDFTDSITENIKGAGLGYNSRGAFSSVNHLHFQLFIRDNALPVTGDKWIHNGGQERYPATTIVFDDKDSSWNYLKKLHEKNIAYNLLYQAGRIFCFPRKLQGSYNHSDWTAGFSWYEMAGGMLTANRDSFLDLSNELITAEFDFLNLNTD